MHSRNSRSSPMADLKRDPAGGIADAVSAQAGYTQTANRVHARSKAEGRLRGPRKETSLGELPVRTEMTIWQRLNLGPWLD
jgi:hypothetical protein